MNGLNPQAENEQIQVSPNHDALALTSLALQQIASPENIRRSELAISEVDTFVFDYGGVVSFHYCEPWQGNLSKLLGVSPEKARSLLSESGSLGRDYRLGRMTRDQFWQRVTQEAGGISVDPSELELNWAMSYQIDPRMTWLIKRLREEKGAQVGLLSNSDQYRQEHNEREYGLSTIFDFMVSSHTHGVVKPEPEAYVKLLEVADRATYPNKVLYVDDRERNVKPGQNIGLQGYTFSSFEDFYQLLLNNQILQGVKEYS